jgi:hypothetical protein
MVSLSYAEGSLLNPILTKGSCLNGKSEAEGHSSWMKNS